MALFGLSKIRVTKLFSGNLADVVENSARIINGMSSYKVDEIDIEGGTIICLYLGMGALGNLQKNIASKNNTYTVTLVFNNTASGIECVGTIDHPGMRYNVAAIPVAKLMLKNLMDKL